MITRVFSRTLQGGPRTGRALYCQITSAFRNHMRVVLAALVISLLAAAIAAPATSVRALVDANLGTSFGISAPKNIRPGSPEPVSSSANSFTPAPLLISPPTNLVVTVARSTFIELRWTAPAGIVRHYEVERSESASEPFVLLGNANGTVFVDMTVTNLRSYLYRVRAVEVASDTCALVPSPPSNMVMGTAASFEFSAALGQPIRAQHFHDVRNAVNAVRKTANLTPATWLRSNLTNLEVKAQDIQEVRNRLAEALNVLSIPVGTYQDPVLNTGANGTPISGSHLEQLQTKATSGSSSGSGRPAMASDRAILGEFGPVINLPIVPVHLSVLPDGRVLFWGRDRFKISDTTVIEETGKSQAWIWNIATDEMFVPVPNTTTNLFCSGHSFLPDGRLLVSGGHKDPTWDGDGEKHINIFDFRNSSWVRGPDMNAGRWYPYNVMLGSGKTLIVSGTYFTTPGSRSTQTINSLPQIYNYDNGCLDSLSDTGTNFFSAYPFLHLRPDGRILQIQSPYPFATRDLRSRLFNPANPPSGAWPLFASSNEDHGLGSSVMFDSGGKVLILGGFNPSGQPNNHAEFTHLQGAGATGNWAHIAAMNFKRAYHTATILPDGKILVTGGVSSPGGNNVDSPEWAALNAEMWDAPAFDPDHPKDVRWRTLARHSEIRAYHSVAALLPDGRVLVGGGGRPGAVGEYYPNNPNCPVIEDTLHPDAKMFGHSNVEIYSPPYLFNSDGTEAQRPDITSAPTSISYGQRFFIGTSGATGAVKVSLVRLASVTHGFNQDQRHFFLGESPDPLQVSSSGIDATVPSDSNKLPPGYYMLFVINDGVPSKAKIVSVGSTSIFLKEAPQTTASGEGSTWEQALEFSSSVSGQITHIRFWKAPGESAGHTGRIWTASGTLLATATFTCETASGWQQAPLPTPLQITAGVRYRVTYNINNIVAKTFNTLSSPITSGPFTGWRSYFSTPAGSFPTSGSSSNLFADVVFKPTP